MKCCLSSCKFSKCYDSFSLSEKENYRGLRYWWGDGYVRIRMSVKPDCCSEESRKTKLLIHKSIYVPTLTLGPEGWVMTDRMRFWIHAAEISFLRRVVGLRCRDSRCSFASKVARWGGMDIWFGCLLDNASPVEGFLGRIHLGRPRTWWREDVSHLARECLWIPKEELESVAG